MMVDDGELTTEKKHDIPTMVNLRCHGMLHSPRPGTRLTANEVLIIPPTSIPSTYSAQRKSPMPRASLRCDVGRIPAQLI